MNALGTKTESVGSAAACSCGVASTVFGRWKTCACLVVSIGVESVCPVFGTKTIKPATTRTAVAAIDPQASRTRAGGRTAAMPSPHGSSRIQAEV